MDQDTLATWTTKQWLRRKCQAVCNGRLSHTLFTGGSFFVPSIEFDALHALLAKDRAMGNMPAVQEVHTAVFPFYVDLDCTTPSQSISDSALTKMAATMNGQVEKFFPDGERIRCVVCTKSRGGSIYELGLRWDITPDTTGRCELVVDPDNKFPVELLRRTASTSRVVFTWGEWNSFCISGLRTDHYVSHGGRSFAPVVEYKHGVHLHWPYVLVKVQRALALRRSIIHGLVREDWSSIFGRPVDEADWERIVDHAVYRMRQGEERNGGLRLVGAPKAKPCPCKSGKIHLCACNDDNNRHIMDDNVYLPKVVLHGAVVDTASTHAATTNFVRALRLTTVRCDDTAKETEGWHDHIPPVLIDYAKRPRGKDKMLPEKEPKTSFANSYIVDHPEILSCIRGILIDFSEHYRNSRMTVRFRRVGTKKPVSEYLVQLRHEGAHFCLCKQDFHNSEHVFMTLRMDRSNLDEGTALATMRCYSKKDVAYPQVNGTGAPLVNCDGTVVHKRCQDFAFTKRVPTVRNAVKLFRQDPPKVGERPSEALPRNMQEAMAMESRRLYAAYMASLRGTELA